MLHLLDLLGRERLRQRSAEVVRVLVDEVLLAMLVAVAGDALPEGVAVRPGGVGAQQGLFAYGGQTINVLSVAAANGQVSAIDPTVKKLLADIYSSPGFSNERIIIFLATDLEPLPAGQLNFVREHEEASMAVAWVPLAAAVSAVQAGDLHNGVTALGILSAYAALGHAEGMLPRASQPGG